MAGNSFGEFRVGIRTDSNFPQQVATRPNFQLSSTQELGLIRVGIGVRIRKSLVWGNLEWRLEFKFGNVEVVSW